MIGTSDSAVGLLGWSTKGYGTYGISDGDNVGATGWASSSTGSGVGVWGTVESANAIAGMFTVNGSSPGTLLAGYKTGTSWTKVFAVAGSGDVWTAGKFTGETAQA